MLTFPIPVCIYMCEGVCVCIFSSSLSLYIFLLSPSIFSASLPSSFILLALLIFPQTKCLFFFLYQLISLCNISVPVSLFYLYVPILFLVWLLLSPQLQSPLMSLGIANAYIMYIDWLWPSIVELSTNIILYISCFYSLDKNFHAS